MDSADPRRCKATRGNQQCPNESVQMTGLCDHCGGNLALQVQDKRLYYLAEAQSRDRLTQLSEYGQVEVLRELIALVTTVIAQRVNTLATDLDFLEAIGPVTDLQLTKEKLIRTATSISNSLGELLAKSEVLKLGQQLVQIVADETGDAEIAAEVTRRVMQAIRQQENHVPIEDAAIIETEWRGELDAAKRNERFMSLTEDIALQIVFLEKVLKSAGREVQFKVVCGQIAARLDTIRKLILSAHKLETEWGFLLTPESQQRLAMKIPVILTGVLRSRADYESVIDRVTLRLRDGQETETNCIEAQAEAPSSPLLIQPSGSSMNEDVEA